jgi:hypothetical protein
VPSSHGMAHREPLGRNQAHLYLLLEKQSGAWDLQREELVLPESGERIPFEGFAVGEMKPGITDPSHPEYDSLADWYARGAVLEVRIP